MAIDDFKGTRPIFLLEQFFVGRIEGWAVVESLVGGLLKRATIAAHGNSSQTRKSFYSPRLTRSTTGILTRCIGRYERATRVGTPDWKTDEGDAIGEQAGCAFHWKYTRDTPQIGGKSFKLNFDNWFYAIDDRTCIVRGSAGRAGIPFATAHITYRRHE